MRYSSKKTGSSLARAFRSTLSEYMAVSVEILLTPPNIIEVVMLSKVAAPRPWRESGDVYYIRVI